MLGDVMGDGGQWTMAMNIYTKYGAVPRDLSETESSGNTEEMNHQLRSVLHQAVAHMFEEHSRSQTCASAARHATVSTIHLGTPPTEFDWEWTDEAVHSATGPAQGSGSM